MDPKASILVPVYNRKALIGPCLESALAQTVKEIEVVVCDNCSTDGTWNVLQGYAARDPRVRVFRNTENLGPVRNWARCVEEARAPYAKLLFSDDLMAPNYLERTLPFIELPGVGLVFTACEVGEGPGNSPVHYSFAGAPGVWNPGRFLLGHVFAYDVPVSPAAALFHTADLCDILLVGGPASIAQEFLRTGAGPDLLLFLEAENRHGQVAHVPESLVFFRVHPGSITIQEADRVSSLYRRTISWFLARNRPTLLRCYLSGIQFKHCYSSGIGWNMNRDKGRAEVLGILHDLGLPTAQAPRGAGYITDLMRHIWSRLRRQFHRTSPV